MNHQGFQTPAELYNAAVKLFEKPTEESDIKDFNNKARLSILKFYTIAPELLEPPSMNEDYMTVFRSIMEWCFGAREFINNLPGRIDVNVLDRMIELLNELKALPVANVLVGRRNKINKLAEKNRESYLKFLKDNSLGNILKKVTKNRSKFLPYIVAAKNILDVKSNNHLPSEGFFLIMAERDYRVLDKKYDEALEKLQEKIYQIIDKINEFEFTPSSTLLDQYDKLKGIKLQEQLDTTAFFYSINAIVDSELIGPLEERENTVDGIIEILKEIKRCGIKGDKDKVVSSL